MEIKTIELSFKGNETINEVYKITLKSLDDYVAISIQNSVNINEIRLKLKDLLAIVENESDKQWRISNESRYNEDCEINRNI